MSFLAPQFRTSHAYTPYQRQPQPERRPSLGEMIGGGLGEGLGQGFGQGLQGSIQQQMKQAALDKILQSIGPNLGPMERAKLALSVDPEQGKVLNDLFKNQDLARSREAESAIAQQSLGVPQAPSNVPAQPQAQVPEQQIRQPNQLDAEETAILQNLPNLEQQAKRLAVQRLNEIRKEKRDVAREMRKEQQQERNLAFKETKAFREDMSGREKKYYQDKQTIDKLDSLNRSGKLVGSKKYTLLKKLGLDVPSLLSPESQEYIKTQNEYLKNIRPLFGSQVSASEVQIYLQGVPTLENTPEGRSLILQNQRIANEAEKVYIDTYREVLDENGGEPSLDIERQVNDRSQAKLSQLAKQFDTNVKHGIELANQNAPTSNKLMKPLPGKIILHDPATGKGWYIDENKADAARAAGWQ